MNKLLLLLSFLLFGAQASAQDAGAVSVAALQAELAKGGVQLVDVRTPHEWSTGHIEGAQHIDWFADDFKERVSRLDRKKPVRLYCAMGGRSEEAREMLRGMGFADVKDLDGGTAAWKQAGAPLVK